VIRIAPLAAEVALVALVALVAPAPARADEPAPPTPEQIEAAKQAFDEGKQLHDQGMQLHDRGKLAEAIERFKESYRLSRNPLLLYNIGVTMDELGEPDLALHYYRRFLKEAPPDAPQRASVAERVKALEQAFSPATAPDTAQRPLAIRATGTYGAGDFEHRLVESAPPGQPLDVTASVPEDSGFTVTLFFRTGGEEQYASRPMTRRYKELVGRIPAARMIGSAVQYYLEVRDASGALVTRAGKATSPNLINLEAGAPPRFFPDLTDDGEAAPSPGTPGTRDDAEDPLRRGPTPPPAMPAVLVDARPRPAPGDLRYARWGSTGAAVALGGLSLVFYLEAAGYADRAAADARDCTAAPPCRAFDAYAAGLQATGERYQTLSRVAFAGGLAVTAVAGYLWFRAHRAPTRHAPRTAKRP
jgi:hypothetical protein